MTIEKKSPCGHRFFAGKNEERILPVSCYLIEHPKGKIPDSGK